MSASSIEQLAAEELLLEAKRGAARASVNGPSGWHKCPLPRTNKRFLRNTIMNTLQANRAVGVGNSSRSQSKKSKNISPEATFRRQPKDIKQIYFSQPHKDGNAKQCRSQSNTPHNDSAVGSPRPCSSSRQLKKTNKSNKHSRTKNNRRTLKSPGHECRPDSECNEPQSRSQDNLEKESGLS